MCAPCGSGTGGSQGRIQPALARAWQQQRQVLEHQRVGSAGRRPPLAASWLAAAQVRLLASHGAALFDKTGATPARPRACSGMLILVFARSSLREYIGEVATASVACGVLGVGGNKGAVAVEFTLHRRKVAVVCSHFAAHQVCTSAGCGAGGARHPLLPCPATPGPLSVLCSPTWRHATPTTRPSLAS